MKRNLSLATMSLIALTCATTSFAGEFFDDFQDKAKSEAVWEVIHREWILKGGTYSAPGAAGLTQDPVTLLPITAEDGMIIEASCGDAGDGNWSNFAVIYSYEDEDIVWTGGAGVGNGQWRMFKLTPLQSGGGAWGTDIVPGVPVKKPLVANEFYHIRIELKGKTATLFASSTPEAKNLNEGNEFTLDKAPTGRIGLAAAGASPIFDWIRVTGKNVEDLFNVDPKGKLATTWGTLKAQR